MIPIAFLIANLVEYLGHRGPMHRMKRGLGVIFRRHTLEHHHFFTDQQMSYESSRDFKAVLFPPVMLLFFIGGIATPIGLALFLLISPNVSGSILPITCRRTRRWVDWLCLACCGGTTRRIIICN